MRRIILLGLAVLLLVGQVYAGGSFTETFPGTTLNESRWFVYQSGDHIYYSVNNELRFTETKNAPGNRYIYIYTIQKFTLPVNISFRFKGASGSANPMHMVVGILNTSAPTKFPENGVYARFHRTASVPAYGYAYSSVYGKGAEFPVDALTYTTYHVSINPGYVAVYNINWDLLSTASHDYSNGHIVIGYHNVGEWGVRANTLIMSSISVDAPSTVPTVNFAAYPPSGHAPLMVSFTDLSQGDISSRYWEFGDGNTSTLQNPAHIYTSPGSYTVNITVTSNDVNYTVSKPDFITALPPQVNANFIANPVSGDTPLVISFTDVSDEDVSSWFWDFGDGNTSTLQNPVHTYSLPGIYTVSLSIEYDGGSDTITKPNYISASYPYPTANFEGSPVSGDAPLLVHFTDLTANNPTSWVWSFGDGSISYMQHPTHTYNMPGTYQVTLSATNVRGTSVKSVPAYITVLSPGTTPTPATPIPTTPISTNTSWSPETGYYTSQWFNRGADFINVEGLFASLLLPFTALIGQWFFMIVWGTIVMGIYLHSQDTTLPFVIGILLGAVISLSAGADGVTVMYLTMAFAGGGVLAKVLLGRL
ncbi:MAG: PKD domain-containing protein [Methanomicrobiales archaeon]|nr:PKD domain-containing protein [Methanomicrobiales archaeon]